MLGLSAISNMSRGARLGLGATALAVPTALVTGCGAKVTGDDTKKMDWESREPAAPNRFYGTRDSSEGFKILRDGDDDAVLETDGFAKNQNRLEAHVEGSTNPVGAAVYAGTPDWDIKLERSSDGHWTGKTGARKLDARSDGTSITGTETGNGHPKDTFRATKASDGSWKVANTTHYERPEKSVTRTGELPAGATERQVLALISLMSG